MALSYGFFNAELTQSGQYDRVYAAEQFAEYFHLIVSNGVFPDPATQLQVVASNTPDMNVNVSDGYGWINGYFAKNEGLYPLAIQAASGTLNRVDAVVLRWVNASRSMELAVKTGTAASSPVTPSLQRDTDVYEIMLATVTVAAGATSIPQSAITDKRADTSVCGWMTGAVQNIDTTNLFAQYDAAFQAWFEDIKAQLEGNVVTNLLNRINAVDKTKVNISDKATESEAISGTSDSKWMTPLKVKKAIGTAPKTVFDTATNQFVTVESIIDHFGMYALPSIVNVGIEFPSTQSSSLFPSIHMVRYKNKLVLFGYCYESSTYYAKYAIVDLNSGDVIKIGQPSTFSSNDRYKTYAYPNICISTDGSLALFSSGSQFTLIDMENNAVEPLGTSYINQAFKSKSKWGYMYVSNSETRLLHYANLGQSNFSYYNLGNSSSSSYYDITLIGVYGDILWFIDRSGQREYRLSKIDLSTGSVTSGVALLSANSYNNLYISHLINDGNKAYLRAQFSPSSGNTKYGTHCLIVNLKDGSTNWSEVQSGLTEDINNAYNSALVSSHYVGSTLDAHFFVYTSCIIEVNRANGAVTIHQLEEQLNDSYLKTGAGCGKAVEFDIPALPNCILFGTHILNTATKELYDILGTPIVIKSESYVRGIWKGYNSFSTCVCMFGGEKVTDCDVISLYGNKTNNCKIIGKTVFRSISTVNPIE